MALLSELIKILLTISNTLLYPVVTLLVILAFASLMFLGGLLSEYSGRSKKLEDKFNGGHLSDFYKVINKLHDKNRDEKVLVIRIERLLQDHEGEMERKLERTRLLAKIGPTLGLMGTLIPMGPALIGLSMGDIESLATNLVTAFTTTVVGLFIGVVFLVITTIRKGWYAQDMKDMEYKVEMLIEGGEMLTKDKKKLKEKTMKNKEILMEGEK